MTGFDITAFYHSSVVKVQDAREDSTNPAVFCQGIGMLKPEAVIDFDSRDVPSPIELLSVCFVINETGFVSKMCLYYTNTVEPVKGYCCGYYKNFMENDGHVRLRVGPNYTRTHILLTIKKSY